MISTLFYMMTVTAAQAHGLDLVLLTQEEEVSRGEPVVVTMQVSNRSKEKFEPPWGLERSLEIYIATPDGTEHEFGGLSLLRGGIQPSTRFELEPGERGLYDVVLSDWHMFSEIGEYNVSVGLAEEPGGEIYKKSNVIALQVSAYSPERLEQRARVFYSRAMAPSSHGMGRLNAKALSLIIDPLAVPMLERVLQEGNRWYREIVADGLVRQGSLEAVDVLTRNLGRFGDGEEGQEFDELLYRSIRQIGYPDISPWLMVRNPPDPEAKSRAKSIVDRANRGYMILN